MEVGILCQDGKNHESQSILESFEKCSILFKVKSKIPDFEREKTKILTTGIHRVFRGLKFEPDAEIGQKGAFCKGLDTATFI